MSFQPSSSPSKQIPKRYKDLLIESPKIIVSTSNTPSPNSKTSRTDDPTLRLENYRRKKNSKSTSLSFKSLVLSEPVSNFTPSRPVSPSSLSSLSNSPDALDNKSLESKQIIESEVIESSSGGNQIKSFQTHMRLSKKSNEKLSKDLIRDTVLQTQLSSTVSSNDLPNVLYSYLNQSSVSSVTRDQLHYSNKDIHLNDRNQMNNSPNTKNQFNRKNNQILNEFTNYSIRSQSPQKTNIISPRLQPSQNLLESKSPAHILNKNLQFNKESRKNSDINNISDFLTIESPKGITSPRTRNISPSRSRANIFPARSRANITPSSSRIVSPSISRNVSPRRLSTQSQMNKKISTPKKTIDNEYLLDTESESTYKSEIDFLATLVKYSNPNRLQDVKYSDKIEKNSPKLVQDIKYSPSYYHETHDSINQVSKISVDPELFQSDNYIHNPNLKNIQNNLDYFESIDQRYHASQINNNNIEYIDFISNPATSIISMEDQLFSRDDSIGTPRSSINMQSSIISNTKAPNTKSSTAYSQNSLKSNSQNTSPTFISKSKPKIPRLKLISVPESNIKNELNGTDESQFENETHDINSQLHRDFRLSLIEKQFLIKLVLIHTGVNVSYSPTWTTHFKNGYLLIQFWNELLGDDIRYLDDLIDELDLVTSYSKLFQNFKEFTSPRSSSIKDKYLSPRKSTKDSKVQFTDSISKDWICDNIEDGRSDIILSILCKIVERATLSMYTLRNDNALLALKYPEEEMDYFATHTTSNELFFRHIEKMIKEIENETPDTITHMNDFRDPRFYAIILKYLHPNLINLDLYWEILNKEISQEESFQKVIQILSILHKEFSLIEVKELISNSEIIHFYIISRIFKIKSGLNVPVFSWDKLKLLLFFLKEDIPSVSKLDTFNKIQSLATSISSYDSTLMEDFKSLYSDLKEKFDSLESQQEKAINSLNEKKAKEKQEVMQLFDAYKDHAVSQIKLLQQNNEKLQDLLQNQTLGYEKQIKILQHQIEENQKEIQLERMNSLENENRVLFTEIENMKSLHEEQTSKLEISLQLAQESNIELQNRVNELEEKSQETSLLKEIESLQDEIQKQKNELFVQRQLNTQLSLAISNYRAQLEKLSNQNKPSNSISNSTSNNESIKSINTESSPQGSSYVSRDRYSTLFTLAQDMRSAFDQKLEIVQHDIQLLQSSLIDFASYCPPKVYLKLLQEKFKSNQKIQANARFKNNFRVEEGGVWINCVGFIISRCLLYWREIDVRTEKDPKGVIQLDGTYVKSVKDYTNFNNNVLSNISLGELYPTNNSSNSIDSILDSQSSTNQKQFNFKFMIIKQFPQNKKNFQQSSMNMSTEQKISNPSNTTLQELIVDSHPTEINPSNFQSNDSDLIYTFSVSNEKNRQLWIKEITNATKIHSLEFISKNSNLSEKGELQ